MIQTEKLKSEKFLEKINKIDKCLVRERGRDRLIASIMNNCRENYLAIS